MCNNIQSFTITLLLQHHFHFNAHFNIYFFCVSAIIAHTNLHILLQLCDAVIHQELSIIYLVSLLF